MSENLFDTITIAHREVLESFIRENRTVVEATGRLLAQALQRGNTVLVCGNGGSAADAQHLAGEIVGRFLKERSPYAAIALSTDTSVLTAIGNDYGFDEVFARQVQGLGRKGDVLVAISTSGNSPNILRALETARDKGILTIGLTGRDGGRMASLCDHCVIVRHPDTPRIQEMHLLTLHTWCALIDAALE